MKDMDKTVSLILAKVKPKSGIRVGMDASAEDEAGGDDLSMIAEELIAAVKDGDTKGVVEALRGAFLTLDAQPHVEGEHVDEESEEYEEGEEEGEEHEAAESAGHEAGEKYGGEMFKKYFGGGMTSRYADGGTVEDDDRLDLPQTTRTTRGDKKTSDAIMRNQESTNRYKNKSQYPNALGPSKTATNKDKRDRGSLR